MSTAGVHRLCWDARILLVLHFMVNAILFVQNMQIFTVAVQYDASSFRGVEMHTDSAFDRSTLIEMHRLKSYRYASTVVQNVCANLLRTRSSKQTVLLQYLVLDTGTHQYEQTHKEHCTNTVQ